MKQKHLVLNTFLVLSSFNLFSAPKNYLSLGEIKNKFSNKNHSDGKGLPSGIEINDIDEVIEPMFQTEAFYRKTFLKNKYKNIGKNIQNKSIDRRVFDTNVKKQFGPTCTAFGISASMENLLENPEKVDVSERHVWNSYRRYSAAKAILTALDNPFTEEKYWPSSEKEAPSDEYLYNRHIQLTHANFLEDDLNKAIKALNKGNAVYLAFRVTKSISACDSVLDPDSPATRGGHAVAISGYHLDDQIPGGGYFIIKNSWGDECGDKGFQYMPFNQCTRSDLYCSMWELYGIKTKFKEVDDKDVAKVDFNIDELEFSYYEYSESGKVKILGDYTHLGQIKYVRFYNKTTGDREKVRMKYNISYDYSFKKEEEQVHHLLAKIYLNDGKILEYPIRFEFKN